MNLRKTALLIGLLPILQVSADNDFGIWTEAAIEKEINKRFSVEAGVEFRSEDNLSRASRWGASVGATYKPCKFLSLSAGYVFLHDYSPTEADVDYKTDDAGNLIVDGEGNSRFNGYNVDHGFWRNKHRAVFDVTGKINIGKFVLSLRERYQYTHSAAATVWRDRYRRPLPDNYVPSEEDEGLYQYNDRFFTRLEQVEKVKKAGDKHLLRSRLKLAYKAGKCPFEPYVSYELHNNFCNGMSLDKTRLIVGSEWKVTKQHRIDLAYIFENPIENNREPNRHVLSVGYKLKF